MTTELPAYPAYKDSGIPWLGKIPNHWELKPGLAAFAPKQVKNIGLREKTVLSLSYGSIVIKPQEKLHGLVPESFETYQIVEPGDIIIRGTDLQNDKQSLRIGLSRDRGIITSAYICLKPRLTVSSEYAYQILNVYDLTKALYAYGSGLRQNLDTSDLKRIPVFLPPRGEQDAITRYLHKMDRRIARFIRNRRRLIEVLNEQKQAIINRAVTRGLDPNAPLKPSGVDWLGEIPDHWGVVKVRTLFGMCGSGTTPSGDQYYAGPVPWLMTGDLNDSMIAETSRHVTREALEDHSALKTYPAGALVIALYGATIGKTGITTFKCCTNQACSVLAQPKEGVDTTFVQRVFMTAKPYLLGLSYGGGQPNINSEIVRSLRIPLPPHDEQTAILAHISSECEPLDSATIRARSEIDLIREYRSRLIADVVTGKVDVRDLAPPPGSDELEETIDELEPLDDAAGELDEEALAGEVA